MTEKAAEAALREGGADDRPARSPGARHEGPADPKPGVRSAAIARSYGLAARGSLVLVLAALIVTFTALKGGIFFSASNFEQILTAQAATGILALAVTVALVAGEIDLSVAGVMGTSAAVVSYYLANGMPVLAGVLIALALAVGIGLVNGLLVTYARLSSIISTLATGTIATGVGLAIVGPNTISGLPGSFVRVFSAQWAGIQAPFYMFVVITLLAAIVYQRTPLGRRLFFIGENSRSATLLGIRVRRLKIGSLVMSAFLSGLAGVVLAGQSNAANVTQTAGYLLPAFAAAFLGTSAITPGRFNAIGSLIATYVLGVATVGLDETNVPDWSSYVFTGGLLIISLGVFTTLKIRREHAAKARTMQEAVAIAEAADEQRHG